MRLLKNKFFMICLCVAVGICGVGGTLGAMGYQGFVRDAVMTVTYPARWIGMKVADGVDGFKRYFSSIDALEADRDELEERVAELEAENARAKLIEKENEKLRAYLDMKNANPDYKFESASVVSREASNFATVFTLDKGSIHGIGVNMPVVTTEGLVGCVTEVGLTWCKVTTIIETSSSVGAIIPSAEASAIISGDYTLREQGACKLTYLDPADANLQKGDVVMSSGIGSVYPSGLVIGRIESVSSDPLTRSTVATVVPSADFSDLDEVMILTGY